MMDEHLLLIFVSSGLFAGCANQPDASPQADDSPKIFAIGRYALPTNGFWDLEDHVESMEPGGIKYDSEFQHPHLPLGAVVVDCRLTHRIGATLVIDRGPAKETGISLTDRYGSSWSTEVKVKFNWSHSTTDDLGRSNYVRPNETRSPNILSNGMTLTKKSRVDGIWTLAVTHNGNTVYTTDFQLVGCP